DMDPEAAFKRVQERELEGALVATGDRFEKEDIEWHRRLRDSFLDIARDNPERCVVIPAAQSEDALEQEIWDTITRRFPERSGLGAWAKASRSANRTRSRACGRTSTSAPWSGTPQSLRTSAAGSRRPGCPAASCCTGRPASARRRSHSSWRGRSSRRQA